MGALPNLVIVGAMKCGTTSLHRYLDQHPEIAMSEPKELNFFFRAADAPASTGPSFQHGNWHLGAEWYAERFPANVPVRGEASPGYTSPSYPEVADRLARLLPDARLVYLVRDPLDRAISQYLHHRRDGAEERTLEQALLDPSSQYLDRSRYHARLAPFLEHYAREHIAILDHHDLLVRRREALRSLFRFLGVDDDFWSPELNARWNTAADQKPTPDASLRSSFVEAVREDVERFAQLWGRSLDHWIR